MSFYFCIQTVGAVGSFYSNAVGAERERFVIGVIALASVVELIAGSVLCSKDHDCQDEVAFSVAAGVVSLFVCIFCLFTYVVPLLPTSIFLFIWWTISTGVLTFGHAAPFYLVGNGYLSTWICFIASLYLVHLNSGLGQGYGATGGDAGGNEERPTAGS